MRIEEETLDDILNKVLKELLKRPVNISASRGKFSEIIGAQLILKNPLSRLSRSEVKGTIFSALGELLWYLSGSNELGFIKYYIRKYEDESEDNSTIYGAYGPRLLSFRDKTNQISNVLELLREKPNTRRAVIQIFDAEDIQIHHKEIPCTTTLQFLIRDSKLHLFASMRSNDAFYGLPHDVFAFTMMQELFAKSLNLDLGYYYHNVGSLHLYEDMIDQAQLYLGEGHQSTTIRMPEMSSGDPWGNIKKVIELEELLRKGCCVDYDSIITDQYWLDIVKLLDIFSASKRKDKDKVLRLQRELNALAYNTYIEKKKEILVAE